MASDVIDLPQPDLADEAENFALGDLERDAADEIDGRRARTDRDAEIVDFQHAHASPPSISRKRGSSRSRSESPTRLSAKRGENDHHARKEQQPRGARDELSRLGEHVAPARDCRRRTEAEEVERGGSKLREGKHEACLDEERRDEVISTWRVTSHQVREPMLRAAST